MIRKENGTASDDHAKIFKFSSSTSSKTWSRLNDPRIVRVSRGFGGKDRHSKVFTVKGLRDRRIRLSVPTALHLYDLQERLGLNQPSKVVDWLLQAAKDDIDELPPLQIPPGSFCHNVHQIFGSNSHQNFKSCHDKQAVLTIGTGSINWLNHDQFKNPRSNFLWGSSKDAAIGGTRTIDQKDENSARFDEEQGAYVSANNFLTRSNVGSSSFLNPTPYNSFLKWDPSNLTLSQHPPKNHALSEDLHNFNLVQLPYSTLSVPSGSQQVLLYQPAGISQSCFPSHVSAMDTEFVPKNQTFQGLHLSNSSNILPSQNNSRNERNKDVGFHLH